MARTGFERRVDRLERREHASPSGPCPLCGPHIKAVIAPMPLGDDDPIDDGPLPVRCPACRKTPVHVVYRPMLARSAGGLGS